MYALSAIISGPAPGAWAKTRAGDKASPTAVVAVIPRTLRRFILVPSLVRNSAGLSPFQRLEPPKMIVGRRHAACVSYSTFQDRHPSGGCAAKRCSLTLLMQSNEGAAPTAPRSAVGLVAEAAPDATYVGSIFLEPVSPRQQHRVGSQFRRSLGVSFGLPRY